MPAPEDSTDPARAAALAAWLSEQPIPGRARTALLRDLQWASDGSASEGESQLRGLDREGFVAQLHSPDGGAVAAVAGIGPKTLADLRRAISSGPEETPLARAEETEAGKANAKDAETTEADAETAAEDSTQEGEAAEVNSREANADEAEAAEETAQEGETTVAGASAPAPDPEPVPKSAAASDADDALAALVAAADGLLVPSESEYPFTPFEWEGAGSLTPEALLAQLGLPSETPVEVRSLESFFGPLSQTADWMGDQERAQAARFAALQNQIASTLTGAKVYRIGERKITVIIAGESAAGRTGGLRTTVIET